MVELPQRKLLLIAVILGVAATLTVFFYLRTVQNQLTRAQERVTVVVAKQNIPAKTPLSAAMLTTVLIPREAAHPQAFTDPKEAVDSIARSEIFQGEQVLRPKVVRPGEGSHLTYQIPPGKRAVTVAVNEITGVAGMVRPGDRVDVLATVDKELAGVDATHTILQNIVVLASGDSLESKESDKAKPVKTVTLAVTSAEAEILTLAEEKAKIRLALRSAGENALQVTSGAGVETLLRQGSPPPETKR